MCDETNDDIDGDDDQSYDYPSTTQSSSKKWAAYSWQGNHMGSFDSEREAQAHLDRCDMSGTVKPE